MRARRLWHSGLRAVAAATDPAEAAARLGVLCEAFRRAGLTRLTASAGLHAAYDARAAGLPAEAALEAGWQIVRALRTGRPASLRGVAERYHREAVAAAARGETPGWLLPVTRPRRIRRFRGSRGG